MPNEECELSIQLRDELFAVQPKAFEDHLGVRPGPKRRTVAKELTAKRKEVVDLTVENDRQASVSREHGLDAAIDVDDGEPRASEGTARIEPGPLSIRAPACERRIHAFHLCCRTGRHADDGGDPAHG